MRYKAFLLVAVMLGASAGCDDEPAPPAVPPASSSMPASIDPTASPDPTVALIGPMPARLVGLWNGGSNDAPEGHWYFRFSADGGYEQWNDRTKARFNGTAHVEDKTLILEPVGQPARNLAIYITPSPVLGDLLFLDDQSYVRVTN